MKERNLIVVNLDEIARRWQIPVERIKYFITDCDMPLQEEARGEWFSEHADLILQEKQKAFEDSLFPERFRTPMATSAKIF